MKKALVLGVLAFFAINCTTVNAQDRTNVQEKGKKSYNQEPASKKEAKDTKNINQGKKQDPTQKNLNTKAGGTSKVQGTKGGNKVTKNKGMNDASKKNAAGKKEVTTGNNQGKGAESEALQEKTKVESEQAPSTGDSKKAKNVTSKTTKENKSVPPTPKEKKNVQGKAENNDK